VPYNPVGPSARSPGLEDWRGGSGGRHWTAAEEASLARYVSENVLADGSGRVDWTGIGDSVSGWLIPGRNKASCEKHRRDMNRTEGEDELLEEFGRGRRNAGKRPATNLVSAPAFA
jgi:hypothetical protein